VSIRPPDRKRRRLLALGGAAALSRFAPAARAERHDTVRIGLTPVFLDDQVAFLNAWRDYLAARLDRPVSFVQKGSYREIVELVRQDGLDFAWVCGYPYVRHQAQMRLLAVPLYQGAPRYQSYLIVPASDTRTRSLLHLRGRIFAYSDPDSNSGYLYPQFSLLQARENPARFFARHFFTWSHRKVVDAVASGLAQGGAVDGYIWDTLRLLHPELVAKTRVVEKSPEFGFPPFVARAAIPKREFESVQQILLGMANDPGGAGLLQRLNLDGFTKGDAALFEGVAKMMHVLDASHVAAS
jgi:phosphonate transport system substrate-binding protein